MTQVLLRRHVVRLWISAAGQHGAGEQ